MIAGADRRELLAWESDKAVINGKAARCAKQRSGVAPVIKSRLQRYQYPEPSASL
jgi:hypothetical protein